VTAKSLAKLEVLYLEIKQLSLHSALSADGTYITAVQDRYNAAASNSDKLDVVITEFSSRFSETVQMHTMHTEELDSKRMQPNIDESRWFYPFFLISS
jgi:hypothetical protein